MADTRDFMFGVVIGGVIGAAAALLYAPQAGTETRVMLKDKATEAKEKTEELAHQAKVRAMEMKEQAQARATDFLSPEEVDKFAEFRKLAVKNNQLAMTLNRKLMGPK